MIIHNNNFSSISSTASSKKEVKEQKKYVLRANRATPKKREDAKMSPRNLCTPSRVERSTRCDSSLSPTSSRLSNSHRNFVKGIASISAIQPFDKSSYDLHTTASQTFFEQISPSMPSFISQKLNVTNANNATNTSINQVQVTILLYLFLNFYRASLTTSEALPQWEEPKEHAGLMKLQQEMSLQVQQDTIKDFDQTPQDKALVNLQRCPGSTKSQELTLLDQEPITQDSDPTLLAKASASLQKCPGSMKSQGRTLLGLELTTQSLDPTHQA